MTCDLARAARHFARSGREVPTLRCMNTPTKVLVVILGAAGIAHFVIPNGFDAIVPHALPGSARMWTYISGGAELAVATVVAAPRTRRLGGGLAVALFVAVFPANIQMAIDWSDRSWPQRLIAYGRLPLQIPLVWLAWRVYRSHDGAATTPVESPVQLHR